MRVKICQQLSIFEGLPQILTGRVQNDEQYGFGQDYLDLFVTKVLSDISDINDHVISVATSIKYFRERRHERQKTPKIHQCRIVLKKFGQKFFQAVFLHGEVLFPTFFVFWNMLNIPAAGILRHVRHYLVKVYV